MILDLNADPGTGNLNARAYLASLVGPRRVLFSNQAVKRVPRIGRGMQLSRNGSAEDTCTYVEVWLPRQSLALPGGGVLLSIGGDSEQVGENSLQFLINATQRFSAVLLQSEQIYALALQAADGSVLANDVAVVVASVSF